MNRRTLLQSAGVSAAAVLAGCVDGVQEHFGLQGSIPLEINNETDQTHDVHLQAYQPGADRQSYEQSYSVTPGETVGAPHLDKVEQSFRVARIENEDEADVSVASIRSTTEFVFVRLAVDGIEIEVQEPDGTGNETDESNDSNETDDSNASDATQNETDGEDDA